MIHFGKNGGHLESSRLEADGDLEHQLLLSKSLMLLLAGGMVSLALLKESNKSPVHVLSQGFTSMDCLKFQGCNTEATQFDICKFVQVLTFLKILALCVLLPTAAILQTPAFIRLKLKNPFDLGPE